MGISLSINGDKIHVVALKDSEFAISYKIEIDQEFYTPEKLIINGNEIEVRFGCCTLRDFFIEDAERIVIERQWEINKSGFLALYFNIELKLAGAELMYPAVLYNRNKFGKGLFLRGGLAEGWSIREDRLPIPSCSVIYNSLVTWALYTEPARFEKYISSVQSKSENDTILLSIRIPAEEKPYAFTGKKSVVESVDKAPVYLPVKEADDPFVYRRKFFLTSFPGSGSRLPLESYRSIIKTIDFGEPEPLYNKNRDWTEFVRLKIKNLLFLLNNDGNNLHSYFLMGKGNGSYQPFYNYTAGSFLVRSLDGAYLLAKLGFLTGRKDLVKKGKQIGTFFMQGKRDLGLHYDNYDKSNNTWGGYLGVTENEDFKLLFNARANGETMSGYIRLYKQLMEAGMVLPEFFNLVKENAEFYLLHQLDNGSFGRWWDEQGRAVNTEGTNGAHVVSFLLELKPYYDESERIEQALERAAKYYGTLVDKDEYYGDTLDADTFDRESGQVLFHMFLDLYENNPKSEYLDKAKRAADFLLTWIWQYNVVFPDTTLLYKKSFHTSGLTSVSVAHHHLDFYGLQIGYDFLRLWRITHHELHRSMGLKMIYACKQLIATADDFLGRGAEYEGWQPEQINHTMWDYFDRKDHQKGCFDICISWVTILELTTLLNLKEDFPEYVNFEVQI